MPFTVSGVDAFSSKLMSIAGKVEGGVKDSLRDSAEDLKDDSQRIVPYEDGDLRDAAYARPIRSEYGPAYEVGYEGLPYIIPQHEGRWVNFMGRYGPKAINNYTTPGTGSKYLELPAIAARPAIIAGVKEATRRALRG